MTSLPQEQHFPFSDISQELIIPPGTTTAFLGTTLAGKIHLDMVIAFLEIVQVVQTLQDGQIVFSATELDTIIKQDQPTVFLDLVPDTILPPAVIVFLGLIVDIQTPQARQIHFMVLLPVMTIHQGLKIHFLELTQVRITPPHQITVFLAHRLALGIKQG